MDCRTFSIMYMYGSGICSSKPRNSTQPEDGINITLNRQTSRTYLQPPSSSRLVTR